MNIKNGDKVKVKDGSIWLVSCEPDEDDYLILQEISADGEPTDYFEEEKLHQIVEVIQ